MSVTHSCPPGSAARAASHYEFVPTVTPAQMKLHADMRRDTDPRWQIPDEVIPPNRTWAFLSNWPVAALSCVVAVGIIVACMEIGA